LSSTHIQHHVSLKPYNTFGLDVQAKAFCEVHSLEEFKSAIREKGNLPFLILGGGSNVLLSRDYDGLIILNRIEGKEIVEETKDWVKLKINSGENWHELVMYCVDQGWGGIENLSLIPGTVGAAPMQNIGAYGVELEQVFESLEALTLETLELETFVKETCAFGYRESVFKKALKGKYFIYSVTLKLMKHPSVHVQYGDVSAVLEEKGLTAETAGIQDVSSAVIQIRKSKLPNPKELGNSGSFFKNPVIPKAQFETLKQKFPDIKGYEQEAGVKVPAGWLIEHAGWKGKRVGNTGSHAKQALVLVNYGDAKGEEIWQLAQDIIADIETKYGICLDPEVNVI
jgi:UDP-N-acetylmuramate dehydrogenase